MRFVSYRDERADEAKLTYYCPSISSWNTISCEDSATGRCDQLKSREKMGKKSVIKVQESSFLSLIFSFLETKTHNECIFICHLLKLASINELLS